MNEPGDVRWQHDARREFLVTSVAHNQDAIRGTDTKASVGLVLHGIIFSGVITLTTGLGPTYDRSGDVFRGTVIFLLAAAGFTLTLSVLALISVARPSPRGTNPQALNSSGYYFPQLEAQWKPGHVAVTTSGRTWTERVGQLKALDGEQIDAELAVELLRVSVLRTRKTKLASFGFKSLAVEIAILVVYLAVLGFHAVSRAPTMPSNISHPSISGSWNVGSRLAATAGTWEGTNPVAYSYQWQRCAPKCNGIAGATRSSYKLRPADAKARIRVLVTASNKSGTAIVASSHVGPISPVVKSTKTDGPKRSRRCRRPNARVWATGGARCGAWAVADSDWPERERRRASRRWQVDDRRCRAGERLRGAKP